MIDSLDIFYQLPISVDRVKFIETSIQFNQFLSDVEAEPVLGFDSEFYTSVARNDQIATVQIASRNQIYILDFMTLLPVLSVGEIENFIQSIFIRKTGLLIGYSLKSDFRVLGSTCPLFQDLEWRTETVLDLEPLFRNIESQCVMPHPTNRSGLSGLVERVLGQPLDKSEQISAWAQRPLSQNQIVYAALDAFVLLEVYDKLKVLAEESNKLEHFIATEQYLLANQNKLPKLVKPKNGAKGRTKERIKKEPPPPINSFPIIPPELRISCDTMLQGLCRKLRLHGVDCVTPLPEENYKICGIIAAKENRFILTRGSTHFASLKTCVPPGHCLQILSDKPDMQLREVWTYFNVISIDKFVFTRCVECNGNCFISIPQKIALILAQNLAETNENCSYEPLPFPETLQSGKIESGLRELSLDKDDVEVSCTGLDLNVIEDCDKMFAKDSCQDNEIAIDYVVESNWFITSEGKINLTTSLTGSGIPIRIGEVPLQVVRQRTKFFACSVCGKMYYEGSHWNRFLNKVNQENK